MQRFATAWGITSLLLLLAVALPVANATSVTFSISGSVIPSQGQEGDITGSFSISGSGEGTERGPGLTGTFTGRASLQASGPGLGPVSLVSVSGPVTGSFSIQGGKVMISFTGVTGGGQQFRGQLSGDCDPGRFQGFFITPAQGFLSLVFVEGSGSVSPCALSLPA